MNHGEFFIGRPVTGGFAGVQQNEMVQSRGFYHSFNF